MSKRAKCSGQTTSAPSRSLSSPSDQLSCVHVSAVAKNWPCPVRSSTAPAPCRQPGKRIWSAFAVVPSPVLSSLRERPDRSRLCHASGMARPRLSGEDLGQRCLWLGRELLAGDERVPSPPPG